MMFLEAKYEEIKKREQDLHGKEIKQIKEQEARDKEAKEEEEKMNMRRIATPQAAEALPDLHRSGSTFDEVHSILNRQDSSHLASLASPAPSTLGTKHPEGSTPGHEREREEVQDGAGGAKKRRQRTEEEKALHAKKERFYRSLNSGGLKY